MLTLSYAPNVSWLFPELAFADRIYAVARAGFVAIEFGFPSQADIPAVEASREEYGLVVALFNMDVAVWDGVCRGYLADPKWRDEFDRTFEQTLRLAERLGCRVVHVPVGNRVPEMSRDAQREQIVENLRRVAPLAEQQGLTITIEALNQLDNPGFYLSSSREGFQIVEAVDHPNVRFQYDFYHIQLQEGNLINTFTEHIAQIGHFQVADPPGRHEPGTGEINFPQVLAALAATGYDGYVGLEYSPQAQGNAALDWLPSAARGNRPEGEEL